MPAELETVVRGMGERKLALDHEQEPVEGDRLGRYRVYREIAIGGMASVHLAVPEGATRSDQVVALKCVHPHLAQQRSFVEMFLDEARLTARIVHPNVCRVLDWGRGRGTYFLAMEYLRGEPLARVMKAFKRLDDSQSTAIPVLAARLCCDAARGLHAAHDLRDEHGAPLDVVHRDVSPHNIFVTYDGITSVVDFGIARAQGRLHHTETGTIKGKFAYMAPEQMSGLPIDRRADVWSLGVVFWEILAGTPLFRRRNESETILAVACDEQLELGDYRAIDPALNAIVKKALARDPKERFLTAGHFADALDLWLSDQAGPHDTAEVAAWMHELFPGGAARANDLAVSAVGPTSGSRPMMPAPETSAVHRRGSGRGQTAVVLGLAAALLAGSAAAAFWNYQRLHPSEVPTTASDP